MKLLVTGGAGFIGSQLCESLIKRGDDIICIDNFNDFYDPQIKRNNIKNLVKQKKIILYEADISNYDSMEKIFSSHSFDAIVHLAARAGVRPSIKHPLLYEKVNVNGTMNLLELSKINNVKKFVFASSSSVYGNNKKVPFCEDDNVDNPVSPYAASKKAGELIAYTYYHLYQISVSVIRFFTVYGPRQRPDMAIHKFTRLIDKGEKIPVFGDGSTKRDYTFISDIIDGVISSIARCDGYEIYNLGDSKTVNLLEMIQTIEKYLGKSAKFEYMPSQTGVVDITYADISKAGEKLDYSPKVYFDEGIKNFVDWYKHLAKNFN